jgi:metal-responsive CopG/Arc/MetJ family transcriptional regulator
MASERFTITLPGDLSARVRKRARDERKPVSRVIADALRRAEEEEIRRRMIEGYKAAALDEETRRVTAEFEALDAEDWPEY